jgi:hypothetical protein
MFIKPTRLFKSLAIFACMTSLPLFAQIHPTTDGRLNYQANLVLSGQATFNVSKMNLIILSSQDLTGPNSIVTAAQTVGQSVASNLVTTYIEQSAVDMCKGVMKYYISQDFVENVGTDVSIGWVPVVGWIVTAAEVVAQLNSMENVQYRNYYIVAPTAGWYTFNVWVPGDWTDPDSMIKIFSFDSSGNQTQVYNFDAQLGHDQVITAPVYLPRAGLCRCQVSVGSGTLLTHTAGHLQSALLDNPTPLQWTVPSLPITIQAFTMLNYLPSVGSTVNLSVPISLPPTPSNILNGTVTYSNIQPLPAILPPVVNNTYYHIDIYGDPTPDQQAELGTWPTLYMNAAAVGTPSNTGNGGTWTFIRTNDYFANFTVRATFHLTQP